MLKIIIRKFKSGVKRLATLVFPVRLHLFNIKAIAKNYDMFCLTDEIFYKRIYLKFIKEEISRNYIAKKLRILDAGCGQGRISIPLAKMGHSIDGVDFIEETIAKAKANAAKEKLGINFICEDLSKFLNRAGSGEYDAVVCTEVLYMLPDYLDLIEKLSRVLKIGGFFIISIRPKLFNIRLSVMLKDLKKAKLVLNNNNGNSIGWFMNWFSISELKDKLNSAGIKDINCYGIGVVSGIAGDPQSCFMIPSQLESEKRDLLFELETELACIYPESGRYILAIGRKR